MIIEQKDGGLERMVLISMIVDREVLGKVAQRWTMEGLFASDWCNLIGGWCARYYNKYGKAPKQMIETLFRSWAEKARNKKQVEIVETFLGSLNGEYKNLAKRGNSGFSVDTAAKHFNEVSLLNLSRQMKDLAESGRIEEAQALFNGYQPIDFGKGAWIDVLQDKSAIEQSFTVKRKPMLTYAGDAGKYFGDCFAPDTFIAFQAIPGRGKSFMLQDICYRGVLEQKNVVMFQIGDMSEAQIMRRLMVRIAQKPAKQRKIRWPVKLDLDEDGSPLVEFEEQQFDEPLDWEEAYKACERVIKSSIRSDDSNFKLSVYPNYSINVMKIKEELKILERSGFVPHIIGIDYADLLLNPPGIKDSLEGIDATWRHLRGISQEFHCCLVTVTQSGSSAAKAKTQGMQHFGGRWTKFAHCTDFFAIDQTKEEKEMQVIRVTSLKGREREDSYYVPETIYMAQCLGLANACVISKFGKW